MKQDKERKSFDVHGSEGPSRVEEGEELRPTMEAEKGGGSPLRGVVLLLLLLVVAVGAAVVSYLSRTETAPTPPAREKHRMAIPRPDSPAAVPSDGKVETVQVQRQPIPIAAPSAGEGAPAPAPKEPQETAAVPGGSEAQTVHPAPPPPALPTPAPPGAYALETGPLVLPGELASAERTLRRLGFEPQRVSTRQEVSLIRLRVGVFPPSEAKVRLKEIAAVVPSAFSLPQGENVAVYAATYYDIDKARSFADQIYLKGVRVEEERAQVAVRVQRLRFGSFPDRESATRTAQKLEAAGLETSLSRR